jgi:hypothetical protein
MIHRSQELTDEALNMFVRDPARDPAANAIILRLANERWRWRNEAKFWKTIGKISFRFSIALAIGNAIFFLLLVASVNGLP